MFLSRKAAFPRWRWSASLFLISSSDTLPSLGCKRNQNEIDRIPLRPDPDRVPAAYDIIPAGFGGLSIDGLRVI
jgi:hypothetical protein